MQITYNKQTEQITIQDDAKTFYWLITGLLILNLINAALNIPFTHMETIGAFGVVWVVLAIISIYILIHRYKNVSYASVIPVTAIESGAYKLVGLNKRYRFMLKNGRKRSFVLADTPENNKSIKALFKQIGVPLHAQ